MDAATAGGRGGGGAGLVASHKSATTGRLCKTMEVTWVKEEIREEAGCCHSWAERRGGGAGLVAPHKSANTVGGAKQ
eukprot:619601-Pelagomonas_calceolata.AAC.1